MKSLYELCVPRQKIFDKATRDDVLEKNPARNSASLAARRQAKPFFPCFTRSWKAYPQKLWISLWTGCSNSPQNREKQDTHLPCQKTRQNL